MEYQKVKFPTFDNLFHKILMPGFKNVTENEDGFLKLQDQNMGHKSTTGYLIAKSDK